MLLDGTSSSEYQTDTIECIRFGRVGSPKLIYSACIQSKHQLEPRRGFLGIVGGGNSVFCTRAFAPPFFVVMVWNEHI